MRWQAVVVLSLVTATAFGTRVKDIADLYGPMENPLVGYGLVVGLAGTGDDAKFQPAIKGLANLLSTLGAQALPVEVAKSKNCALVTVSATLPAFNRMGDKLDVHVAAVGNAKSLEGGRLVLCPLGAPSAGMLATAEGSLRVEATRPTTGVIERGAIVQREIPAQQTPGNKITFKLRAEHADNAVAARIVETIHESEDINPALGDTPIARAVDAATIEVSLSAEQLADPVPFIAQLEWLPVPGLDLNLPARVEIDVTNGTFYAINGSVEISPVVVQYGNLQVEIKPKRGGQGSTLDDLITALRTLDATSEDVIGVLKALESVGALHAQVVRK